MSTAPVDDLNEPADDDPEIVRDKFDPKESGIQEAIDVAREAALDLLDRATPRSYGGSAD
jgi:hypothetical protein